VLEGKYASHSSTKCLNLWWLGSISYCFQCYFLQWNICQHNQSISSLAK